MGSHPSSGLVFGFVQDSKVQMVPQQQSANPIQHGETLGFRFWKQSGQGPSTAHTHPDVEINFLQTGSLRYFFGGRFLTIKPGQFAVFWAGIPHQLVDREADWSGIWATIPLQWMMQRRSLRQLSQVLMAGRFLVDSAAGNPAGGHDAARLEQWLNDFSRGDPDSRTALELELEARLVRLPRQSVPASSHPSRSFPRSDAGLRIERITEHLATNYQHPLTVDTVARAFQLHPKYLLTLFRRSCGIGLWDYVIRLRLAHAQRLLITTDRTVMDIAFEAGFGSVSGFYHAFSQQVPGISPRRFRQDRVDLHARPTPDQWIGEGSSLKPR